MRVCVYAKDRMERKNVEEEEERQEEEARKSNALQDPTGEGQRENELLLLLRCSYILSLSLYSLSSPFSLSLHSTPRSSFYRATF